MAEQFGSEAKRMPSAKIATHSHLIPALLLAKHKDEPSFRKSCHAK